MRITRWIVFGVLVWTLAVAFAYLDAQERPNLALTPGVARTVSKKAICTLASTKDERHVTQAMKNAAFASYHMQQGKGACLRVHHGKLLEGCEIDHLISLELGGSNSIDNLWPQPYHPRPGAHEKDWLENRMHRAICKNELSVKEAQRWIVTDWLDAYTYFKQKDTGEEAWTRSNR